MRTMSSRDFNQRPNEAMQAARTTPILITNRGQGAYVLMAKAAYDKFTGQSKNIAQALAADDNVELNTTREKITLREVEF